MPAPEEPAAPPAQPVRRDHEGQRFHEVRREPQENGALVARGAQPANVTVLQVADAAVNHLEAVGRGA